MSTITAPEIQIADTSDAESGITPEELLTIPEGKHLELVGGQIRERSSSGLTSYLASHVASELQGHAQSSSLGWVFSATAGYQCFPWKPKDIRRADVSFIRADRVTLEDLSKDYIKIAPDLAVEIVSPNDLAEELEEKIEEYLRAGVRLIWIVYPETRTVHVRRPGGSFTVLKDGDELSGEDVVSGFRCALKSLFPPRPAVEPTPAAS